MALFNDKVTWWTSVLQPVIRLIVSRVKITFKLFRYIGMPYSSGQEHR